MAGKSDAETRRQWKLIQKRDELDEFQNLVEFLEERWQSQRLNARRSRWLPTNKQKRRQKPLQHYSTNILVYASPRVIVREK